jgi:hypothetical protein
LPRAQHAFEIFHSPRTSHFLNAASTWLEWVRAHSGQVNASPEADAQENINQADNESDHD